MNEFVLIEAAAGGGKPKVKGIAYTGGKMQLPGWKYPVVVDLTGIELPDSVPLLTDHVNKTAARIGMASASIKNGEMEVEGEILSESDDAANIVSQAKAGGYWQLSIGAEVKVCALVRDSAEINGQTHEGPFFHVKKSLLREVSIVAVGADADTRLNVTASFHLCKGENFMPQEEITAAKAEEKEDALKAAEAKKEDKTEEKIAGAEADDDKTEEDDKEAKAQALPIRFSNACWKKPESPGAKPN